MSSKPKLNTKKSGGGVPAARVTESDNISDQVPCGKRQVPHHVRYATLPIVQPHDNHMFTLDEITLFFWNISNDARSQREGETKEKIVAGWVRANRQQGASSASGSQSSRALTHRSKASKVSSNSVPSSQAVTRVTAGKYQISDDDTHTNEVGRGAVSDNDEVEGVECEEARNSPAKGKQRANNKVCSVLSLLCRSLRFRRTSLLLNAARNPSLPSTSVLPTKLASLPNATTATCGPNESSPR